MRISKERQSNGDREIRAEGVTEGASRQSMIRRGDMKAKQRALIQKGKMTDFS